jgi:hypothetical protein
MDGVMILQTFENFSFTWGWSWLGLLTIFAALMNLWIFIDEQGLGYFFMSIILGFIAVFNFATAIEVPEPDTYQVLIDESVSMTEFNKRYEILETQGETYIVKEREGFVEKSTE